MIVRTFKGFYIEKKVKGSKFNVYVKGVRNGKVNFVTDYTHARHYTETTAKKLDKEIDDMIHKGLIENDKIMADE